MDLSKVFSPILSKVGQGTPKEDYFLAVKISSSQVLATSWKVAEGKVAIGQIHSARIEGNDFDSLLKAADKVVSQAGSTGSVEINKVIFAVPESWVSEGKIAPAHLPNLRRICQQLDLTPLGYVVLSEALDSFFKEAEGAPLTAILVELDGRSSALTIYRAGKSLGTAPLLQNSDSPEAIVAALENALKQFTDLEALPARIIIYDGKSQLDALSQKITAHPWTGRLPFLHFPRVEILPSDFVIKAVAASGAVQMGASLNISELAVSSPKIVPPRPEIRPEESQQATRESEAELREVSAQEAGFALDADFSEVTLPVKSPPSPANGSAEFTPLPPPVIEKRPDQTTDQTSKKERRHPLNLVGATSFLTTIPKTLFRSLPQPSPPSSLKPPPKLIPLLGVTLLVLILGFAGIFYFLPKATVTLTLALKNFDHEMELAVQTNGSSSSDQKVITGEFLEVAEIGTKKGIASGRKTVGEKAKGNVTIYSVAGVKSFVAGTTITSPDGLKFTLDRDVSVASGDAITPATVSVGVTASNIGATHNLSSGTKFTVASLSSSDYLAKNDSAFSGGSSREATIVTKADQDRLSATLSAELSAKAQEDLQAKLAPAQTLLPTAITSEVSKKKFSKDVDAEAETLSLDMTMNFKGVIFSTGEAIGLFKQEFSSDIPDGYTLTPEESSLTVHQVTVDKKGAIKLDLGLSSKLAPHLNLEDAQSRVTGKSIKQAKASLSSLPGVSHIDVTITPRIFQKFIDATVLPWKKDNIQIEVITE